jgi:hypothetical protein
VGDRPEQLDPDPPCHLAEVLGIYASRGSLMLAPEVDLAQARTCG